VGVVGNEGVFGVNVVLGSVTVPLEAIAQVPGDGLRIPADVIRKEFKPGGLLHDLLLRYTQAFIIQIAQAAACNRSHPVAGRLARWLLMSHDRAMSDELLLTQEFIGIMWARAAPASPKPQADSKITAPSNTAAATSPSSTAKNWNHIRASVTRL